VGVTQTKEETMTKAFPPDPENLNDQRAQWAENALSTFLHETGIDLEGSLADLLCNLMHLADRRDWDFAAELEHAQAHYEAGTTPDPNDLLAAARLVIKRWSSGDLAEAVRHLEAAVNHRAVRRSS
jgi:hypothetical protein